MAPGKAAPSCPSAQPEMEGAVVVGVVEDTADGARVAYVAGDAPVTPDLMNRAGPLPPSRVFRIGAKCQSEKCSHFDGRDCRLAARIATMLDPVVDALPPCALRRTCRWHSQEGKAACLRCPQVVTGFDPRDARTAAIADPD